MLPAFLAAVPSLQQISVARSNRHIPPTERIPIARFEAPKLETMQPIHTTELYPPSAIIISTLHLVEIAQQATYLEPERFLYHP